MDELYLWGAAVEFEHTNLSALPEGERALVISWAARSTQGKCAIEMRVFPASAHWMNEAKAMTGILHRHANTRS